MHYRQSTGRRGGCTAMGCIVPVSFVLVVIFLAVWLKPEAGHSMGSTQFGTYTPEYLARKAAKDQAASWKELCKGGGRYQAMSEAYDAGKPNPCDGSKEWVK